IALEQHPLLSARLDVPSVRGLLVRQDLDTGYATLLGFGALMPQVSVVPGIDLIGALQLTVKNISRPITLCASALRPEPCLPASAVACDNDIAAVDSRGVLRFDEHRALTSLEAVARYEAATLNLNAGAQRLASLTLPVWFETPPAL